MSEPTPLTEQLEKLRRDYHQRLPTLLQELHILATKLTEPAEAAAALQLLKHRLHSLAGAAGTFGQPALGDAARKLEQFIAIQPANQHAAIHAEQQALLLEQLNAFDGLIVALEISAIETTGQKPAAFLPDVIWGVDGDRHVREYLIWQLAAFNYQVRMFDNLPACIEATESQVPEILLLEASTLSSSTDEHPLMARLHNLQERGVLMFYMASEDNFELRMQASRLGALGYFVKPFNIPDLVARIDQSLTRTRAAPGRVLIIEDDLTLAQHYSLVLKADGVDAQVLHQPKHMVEAIEQFRPELILMDLHMPEYSGAELAGVIRQYEKWASLPIVYLSAETDIQLQLKALRQGGDDFLTKPVSDTQLTGAVQARIERSRKLLSLIAKDSLTGLYKHASIKDFLDTEVSRAQRQKIATTVAILDLDHFKKVNDSYGHNVGDTVICALATLLRQRLRSSDIIGRFGGEEFVAILPHCNIDTAFRLLNDIREQFSKVEFNSDQAAFYCTFSAGIACTENHGERNGDDLLVIADKALYQAKNKGRDCVCTPEAGAR